MGTTLTGTTPQDTYDSLIKVTDNGPIGTSLKTLTDGLGNDSALALSSRGVKVNTSATLITDAASLCHFSNNFLYVRGGSAGLSIGDDAFSNSITLADNADIAFEAGSAERMRITSAGNVGIGTSSPSGKLHVSSTGDTYFVLTGGASPRTFSFLSDANDLRLFNGVGDSLVARFTPTGVVEVASGVKFPATQVASADANTLDDYEEGTFTATLLGVGSNPTTPVTTTGAYTKIGRQVSVSLNFVNVDTTGATGAVVVSGMPFTSSASLPASVGSALSSNFTFAAGTTSLVCRMNANETSLLFQTSGTNAAFSNIDHNAGASRNLFAAFTYFTA